MRKGFILSMLCLPFVAYGEDLVVTAGKQRAANARLEWEVRDVSHPRMGAIKVAVPAKAITTAVGSNKIVSLVFVSCETARKTIAIELANAPESDAAAGLRPREMPQLICNMPLAATGYAMRQSERPANWEVTELGDVLARGLSPSDLRRCASLDIVQDVALPRGWTQASQRIVFELTPYAKEVDSIFVACGEATAFAPGADAKLGLAWRPARTLGSGRTNVRASPAIDGAIVAQLPPNARVLVQSTSTEWWKVRPPTGAAFDGYVRQDRLAFE